MFEHLNTRCNAKVYLVEPRSTAAQINTVLSTLASRPKYSQQGARVLRRVLPTRLGEARVSLGVYLVEQEPPFLTGSPVLERRGAFIYVVEYDRYAAVFSRNIGGTRTLLPTNFQELPHHVITRVLANQDTRYERLRLRNMSISASVIRARTLEAVDLRGVLSNITARRSVPTGLRYTSVHGTFSVIPSVSRVQQVHQREGATWLAEWAVRVIRDLPRAAGRAIDFLLAFPTPLTLQQKPEDVVPAGVLLQFDELKNALASGTHRLLVGQPIRAAIPPGDLTHAFSLLDVLGHVMHVVAGNTIRLNAADLGQVRQHEQRYGLRAPMLSYLVVEDTDSGERLTLPGWLGRRQNFIITFSNPEYAYVNGTLFRDASLVAGARLILGMLETDWSVGRCTSEKDLTASGHAYSPGSLFRVTEQKLTANVPIVICDDGGDEWADYIAVDDRTGQRAVTFFHCKHGSVGLSASAFHVVVSQALKNLGRLFPADTEVVRKLGSWNGDFNNQPRIVASAVAAESANIRESFGAINSDPATDRHVTLVVDFLSKDAVKRAFDRVEAGTHVEPSSVQILWLLSSFAHGCLDVGATPHIKCLG